MTDWLLDTLIWTSALMLLVLAIREPVRRQFGAGVAYALWAIPAARILMPTLTHTVERAAPAPAALPASETVMPVFTQTPYLASATTSVAAQPSLIDQLGGWPMLLGAIWVAGAVSLFGNRLVAYLKERRRILTGAELVDRAGSIRIVRSAAVDGPLAFGIVDRVIAVPTHFETHFTPSERRLALEHELAHHRSGDLIANFIAFVLLSLQWFNPLAWASYAAFRFDQEAACDARVLDRADDPAAYGRAIAKAASGRALLFASALDKKSTLKRRLKSMINNTTKGRRRFGNMLVLGCVAVALPLTATKAVEYVETQPTAPTAPTAPRAPTAPAVPVVATAPIAPVAPVAVRAPIAPAVPVIATTTAFQDFADGKPYSQMTAEERAEFDEGMQELREALEEIREERVDVRAEIAEAMADAKMDKAEMRQEMEEARREILQAREELKAERAEMIAEGVDPAVVDASIQAALASLEAIDIEAIMESAMAAVDEEAIQASVEASMAAAEASIRASLAEMEERRRQ